MIDATEQNSEKVSERRHLHDKTLETLINPQFGPQVRLRLQQVHDGADPGAAYAEFMQMLTETASIDRKTGLYLGEAVVIKLERLIEYAKTRGIPLSVAYFDADNFREVNNRISHEAGDNAIKAIAETLDETTRELDITGRLKEEGKPEDTLNKKDEESFDEEENSAARMGGDEFLIVLMGATTQQAGKVVDRFRRNLSLPASKKVPEYYATFGSQMTVSVGIAQYNPDTDQTPLSLIKRAEIAMKKSKRRGRGKTTIADEVIKKPDLSAPQAFEEWLEEMGIEELRAKQYKDIVELWQEQGTPDEIITDRLLADLVKSY